MPLTPPRDIPRIRTIEIVCHRGANAYAPANTLPAAQICVDWGMDYVEVDVNSSSDGVLYIFHGPELEFTTDGIRRLAEIAYQVNEKTENIGARRLYTVMEKLLEEVSFSAGRSSATQTVVVDGGYVDSRLDMLAQREDLARYVL